MPRGGMKRVLIVDNNEHILWSLQEALEDAGFDTCTTWSGHEGLALLQSKEFDVLLVDDYLPDLHSGDFLNRVGRLPFQPWIVVMQGSTPTASEWQHYTLLGASAVVSKRDLAEVCRAVWSHCVGEPLTKARAN